MFSVSYLSACTRDLSDDELDAMNAHNTRRNEKLGLTGVLYHNEGLFFQTIEGEEHVVRDMVTKIAKDNRHERMVTLAEMAIAKRAFPFWTMSYFDESLSERHPDANLKVLREQDNFIAGLHQVFLQERRRS